MTASQAPFLCRRDSTITSSDSLDFSLSEELELELSEGLCEERRRLDLDFLPHFFSFRAQRLAHLRQRLARVSSLEVSETSLLGGRACCVFNSCIWATKSPRMLEILARGSGAGPAVLATAAGALPPPCSVELEKAWVTKVGLGFLESLGLLPMECSSTV